MLGSALFCFACRSSNIIILANLVSFSDNSSMQQAVVLLQVAALLGFGHLLGFHSFGRHHYRGNLHLLCCPHSIYVPKA